MRLDSDIREYVLAQGKIVPPRDRRSFYRWMIRVFRSQKEA